MDRCLNWQIVSMFGVILDVLFWDKRLVPFFQRFQHPTACRSPAKVLWPGWISGLLWSVWQTSGRCLRLIASVSCFWLGFVIWSCLIFFFVFCIPFDSFASWFEGISRCRCETGIAWDFPLAKSEKRELLLQHFSATERLGETLVFRLRGNCLSSSYLHYAGHFCSTEFSCV